MVDAMNLKTDGYTIHSWIIIYICVIAITLSLFYLEIFPQRKDIP